MSNYGIYFTFYIYYIKSNNEIFLSDVLVKFEHPIIVSSLRDNCNELFLYDMIQFFTLDKCYNSERVPS